MMETPNMVQWTPSGQTPNSHPWDKAAVGWNNHSAAIGRWLHAVTQEMLDAANITSGSRVLDIAAGAGAQTLDIARRVGPQGYVLATDISTSAMALAQSNASAAGLLQIETRHADAQALNLAGSEFDAAVCRLGLMFCQVPLNALIQSRQALRSGGRLSALVFSQPQNNPCISVMMTTALKHANRPAQLPYEAGSLCSLGKPGLLLQLLTDAGYQKIEVRAVAAPFLLPTAQHYVDFVRTSGSPIMEVIAALSKESQDDAWREMADHLKVFTTPDGWAGPNELLLCSATAA
jgi:SAM-dependent methyltransferase